MKKQEPFSRTTLREQTKYQSQVSCDIYQHRQEMEDRLPTTRILVESIYNYEPALSTVRTKDGVVACEKGKRGVVIPHETEI